jgi:hypothetical protein
MKQNPLTVAELARLFDRSPRQVRYAIKMLSVEPATIIEPKRYHPDDLVRGLGPVPEQSKVAG